MAGTNGEERAAVPSDLIRFSEVRELLGVGDSWANSLSHYKEFPDPWYVGDKERIWLRAEVLEYVRKREAEKKRRGR